MTPTSTLRYTVRNRFPGEQLLRSRGNLIRNIELMAASDPDLAVARALTGRTILLASHPDLARALQTEPLPEAARMPREDLTREIGM